MRKNQIRRNPFYSGEERLPGKSQGKNTVGSAAGGRDMEKRNELLQQGGAYGEGCAKRKKTPHWGGNVTFEESDQTQLGVITSPRHSKWHLLQACSQIKKGCAGAQENSGRELHTAQLSASALSKAEGRGGLLTKKGGRRNSDRTCRGEAPSSRKKLGSK